MSDELTEAEREARFNEYVQRNFRVPAPAAPEPPEPASPGRHPDLHPGPRAPAADDGEAAVGAWVQRFFPAARR